MGGFLDAKNSMNVAAWRWRWHLQGGSIHWAARPLSDLRNDEDRRRYRRIEYSVRYIRKCGRNVVNLAARRIQRAKRRTQ